ncbi:hypothetical protein GIB67_014034, partial [Kingdonia uniflora]
LHQLSLNVCKLERLIIVSGNSSNLVPSASRCLKLTSFPIPLGSLRSFQHLLSFSFPDHIGKSTKLGTRLKF